jgi:hypothetical protein
MNVTDICWLDFVERKGVVNKSAGFVWISCCGLLMSKLRALLYQLMFGIRAFVSKYSSYCLNIA